MDEIHPKRYISTDNPYRIWKTKSGEYWISFCDGEGEKHRFTISPDLFDLFNTIELEDISFRNESDRHYEYSELTEETLASRAAVPQPTVEEIVQRRMEHERLRRAIARLPDTQRRRLVLYYFGSFTYQQIAEMEGCTIMPVKRSIDQAIKKLKIFLK